MFQSARSSLRELREYLTPVSHTSSFGSTGEITPREFVEAGDYLVFKFPTWSWSSAPASKRRDILPPDKQYLITRQVPSRFRACQVDASVAHEANEVDSTDDGWEISRASALKLDNGVAVTREDTSDREELEEIIDEDDEQAYDSRARAGSKIEQADRSYNLYITYSTSYRVPKVYLSGFNANGSPLSPQEMYEDVIGDYKDKTVTIEKAPFEEDLTLISIHPCRHANVMKVLLDRAAAAQPRSSKSVDSRSHVGDDWEEIGRTEIAPSERNIRADQYLVIFLKFISSVTPGIEHDYTMAAAI